MTAVNDPVVNVFDGVRVVEFAQFVFVPSAGALLADWGADVIKIEHPVTGDGYRGLATQGIVQTSATGVNQNMEMHNRGKRSIGLDASKPEGRELLLKLVASADVFLTNFLPSALHRWNLDVEDLRAANPKIIYARGHGHGVRGADADMPAYDSTAYWSRGGLAETLKPPGQEFPLGPRGGFGDRLGGVNLAFGIASALYRRERTGEPSVVDVSLLGTAVWTIASDMLSALQGNFRMPPAAPAAAPAGAVSPMRMNPNPLGGTYRTKDGRYLGLMLLQPDRHWPDLARALDREDLLADPRFVDAKSIFAQRIRHGRDPRRALRVEDPPGVARHLRRRAVPVGAVRVGPRGARGPAGRRERLHPGDRAPGRQLPCAGRRSAVRRAARSPEPRSRARRAHRARDAGDRLRLGRHREVQGSRRHHVTSASAITLNHPTTIDTQDVRQP